MDDILKRMLAVEQEADSIVRGALAQAERIREAGRQKANENAAEAQRRLSAEVEAFLDAKESAAEKEKNVKLREADAEMRKRIADFRTKVDSRLPEILSILLYPEQ